MGHKTVADTIREITRNHLVRNNGLLLGQAITAAGWVNHTVPNCQGIVELPMTDIAGAGIAVGAALVGRRPIFVIRFQDFLILNGSPLIFFAAKTKELHGKSAPVFVRAIGAESLGPAHSGILHSIFMHFPGFRVCSPMTPGEYEEVWRNFMENDDPMIVSEHRRSFKNEHEFVNSDIPADITLMPISAARFNIDEAIQQLNSEGIKCNVSHIMWLKPFKKEHLLGALANSRAGLVIDAGFEICGAAQSIAYELMLTTGKKVKSLGLEDRSVGVSIESRNPTPSAERIALAAKRLYAEVEN